jgi:hypothetical protein
MEGYFFVMCGVGVHRGEPSGGPDQPPPLQVRPVEAEGAEEWPRTDGARHGRPGGRAVGLEGGGAH